mgnify:CR=1 FL=1
MKKEKLEIVDEKKQKIKKARFFAGAVLLSVALLTQATPAKVYENHNLTEDLKYTIAHAGGGLETSDGKFRKYLNCEESFYKYYENGTRMFEYDLVFTSDNELVGTHKFEYLDGYSLNNRISYEDYLNTKIADEFTGITADKILDLIEKYPDTKFVIDTKEKDDYKVYEKLIEDAEEKGVDISKNVLPFVSSKEMLSKLEKRYNFEEYLFTNYKQNYTTDQLVEIFKSNDKIKYLHIFFYDFVKLDLKKINSMGIRVFAHMDKSDKTMYPIDYGCSGVFTDDMTENYFSENCKDFLFEKFQKNKKFSDSKIRILQLDDSKSL